MRNKKNHNILFLLPAAYCPLFIVCCLLSTGCYAQNPRVVNSNDSSRQPSEDAYAWDFGAVQENTVVKHDFIFKNKTKNVLNIGSLTASCGCTVSKVKKETLKPQEETIIEVQLKTKGYSGDIKQYVYVHTDNMEDPVTRLVIKADVVK